MALGWAGAHKDQISAPEAPSTPIHEEMGSPQIPRFCLCFAEDPSRCVLNHSNSTVHENVSFLFFDIGPFTYVRPVTCLK